MSFLKQARVGTVTVAALATLVIAMAGCAGPSGRPGTPGSTPSQVPDAALFAGEGYHLPQSGPAAAAGKRVWVLSCDQEVTSCSVFADAAMVAGKALGWDMKLYDIRLDPSRAVEGVRQAIADHADGIITYTTDCSIYKQALTEAHAAGVKASTAESVDCDQPRYDANVSYTQGAYLDWVAAWGAAQARLAVAHTGGKAKIIRVTSPTLVLSTPEWVGGVNKGLAGCGGCAVVADVTFEAADLGAGLQQKVQEALVRHPDANAIVIPADALLGAGVEAALRAAGRYQNIYVGLAEGDPAAMAKLRSGQLTDAAGVGIPADWEAYAAADNLNRLFAGQAPVPSGIGLQAFDAHHNLPAAGGYQPPVDFKSAYLKEWRT